jgi:hypothetical protein
MPIAFLEYDMVNIYNTRVEENNKKTRRRHGSS